MVTNFNKFQHPLYNTGFGTMGNDLAILQLEEDAVGTNIEPIPIAEFRLNGGWGHMSGWGLLCGSEYKLGLGHMSGWDCFVEVYIRLCHMS